MKNDNAIDPFVYEIIKNGLISIVEEMFQVTKRAARSPIIYDVLDFSTAITDFRGRVIAQSSGIPLFIGIFDFMIRSIREITVNEGDIIITNDPYKSGTHLNDVGVIMPIFFKDKLVGYCVNKGHWNDIGGTHFGSWSPDATEIYQEGLIIPPVKLYKKGKKSNEIIRIIAENSRIPDFILGDLEAQVASVKIGVKKVKELLKKHNISFSNISDKIINDGKHLAEKKILNIPECKIYEENILDNDMKISVEIEIQHNTHSNPKFKVNFINLPLAQKKAINTTYPGAVAAARTVYMAFLDPHMEYNQGIVAPLEIKIKENTIFAATKPYPVGVYWETTTYAADTIWKALAKHFPDRLSAGHFLSVAAEIIAGKNEKGENFVLVEPNPGGWGATSDSDGESALVSFADGETYASSVEILEKVYPLTVERYMLNTKDGAGRGKHRGGFGIIKAYRMHVDCEITAAFNRAIYPPWGLPHEGTCNYIKIGDEKISNTTAHYVKAGEVIEIHTGGGGGVGEPEERDMEKIKNDIKYGYISHSGRLTNIY